MVSKEGNYGAFAGTDMLRMVNERSRGNGMERVICRAVFEFAISRGFAASGGRSNYEIVSMPRRKAAVQPTAVALNIYSLKNHS